MASLSAQSGLLTVDYITYPGYENIRWEATIEKIEPERSFSFRWHPYAVDPQIDYSGEPATLVEFTLEARDGGTFLTVIESGFESIPKDRRFEAFRMNEGGWEQQMRNIRGHVDAAG